MMNKKQFILGLQTIVYSFFKLLFDKLLYVVPNVLSAIVRKIDFTVATI